MIQCCVRGGQFQEGNFDLASESCDFINREHVTWYHHNSVTYKSLEDASFNSFYIQVCVVKRNVKPIQLYTDFEENSYTINVNL